METMSLTSLRENLYQVVDRVLKTGIGVEIERKGKKLLIVPLKSSLKLSRLKKRRTIVGDPEILPEVKVGTWNELKNLK